VPSSEPGVDTAAHLGRRERKKLATKDRIFDCAVSLFASRGYDSTTMEDIGECADVARATVFNYFPRKEDIVFEWITRRRTELEKVLVGGEQEASDTASRVRQGFRRLAQVYEDDAVSGRAMVRAFLRVGGPLVAYRSKTPTLLADAIRSGQQRGDIPTDIDPTRAGLLLFDTYLGVLYRWVGDDAPLALEDDLVAMIDLTLVGIIRQAPARGTP
jgi:AcrR family transcriptional regulator